MSGHWVDVCGAAEIERQDVIRFDVDDQTYAVYRTEDDRYFATDGACTHAGIHLSRGFVDGTVIECAKHNGRFDFTTGSAQGRPVVVDLGCHDVRLVDGVVQLFVR